MSEHMTQLTSEAGRRAPAKAHQHSKKHADGALLIAFAGGATATEAARRAGVSERTAFRRLQDPAFQKRIAQARNKMVDAVVGQLAEASVTAVQTLRKLCNGRSETVRLGAARSMLQLTMKLHEHVNIESRLASLEAPTRMAC